VAHAAVSDLWKPEGTCFQKAFELRRRSFSHFDRRHAITPDSHKTDGISARKTVCRKPCDFLARAEASLIGRWTKSLRDSWKTPSCSVGERRPEEDPVA